MRRVAERRFMEYRKLEEENKHLRQLLDSATEKLIFPPLRLIPYEHQEELNKVKKDVKEKVEGEFKRIFGRLFWKSDD